MEEKSFEQMRRDFQEFYFTKVKNNLSQINKIQSGNQIRVILISLIGLAFTVFSALSLFGNNVFGDILLPIVFLIGIFIIVLYFNELRNGTILKNDNKIETVQVDLDGENFVKKELMRDFVKIFGDLNWTKNSKTYENINFIKKLPSLNIMGKSIKYATTDDTIFGAYNGVNFRIVEFDNSFSLRNISQILIFLPFILMLISLFVPFALILFVLVVFPLSVKFPIVFPVSVFIVIILFLIFAVTAFFGGLHFICNHEPFHGVFIEFDMNKNFSGHTFLYEKGITNQTIIKKKLSQFSEVKLEDIDFSKRYKVYSTDQVEARYVLTPAFIERFKNIKTAFKAKYLRAAFKDRKITIAVNAGRDLFAMAKYFKKTDEKTFTELFDEILSVLKLIETLKLNQHLGL